MSGRRADAHVKQKKVNGRSLEDGALEEGEAHAQRGRLPRGLRERALEGGATAARQ